jgi:hypothetical protein
MAESFDEKYKQGSERKSTDIEVAEHTFLVFHLSMRIIFQGFTFIRQRLQKVIKSQCPLKSGC